MPLRHLDYESKYLDRIYTINKILEANRIWDFGLTMLRFADAKTLVLSFGLSANWKLSFCPPANYLVNLVNPV